MKCQGRSLPADGALIAAPSSSRTVSCATVLLVYSRILLLEQRAVIASMIRHLPFRGAPSGRRRRLPQTTRPPACIQRLRLHRGSLAPSALERLPREQGVHGGTAYSRRHDSAGRADARYSPGGSRGIPGAGLSGQHRGTNPSAYYAGQPGARCSVVFLPQKTLRVVGEKIVLPPGAGPRVGNGPAS